MSDDDFMPRRFQIPEGRSEDWQRMVVPIVAPRNLSIVVRMNQVASA
jgi:hypothetical protein